MLNLLQKLLFRADRMPERDQYGCFTHPDVDMFISDGNGNLMNPDDEGYIADGWIRECGFDVATVSMEHDITEDHPAWQAYWGEGVREITVAAWKPEMEGYTLVSIHDTDDGPQALFVKPIASDTLPLKGHDGTVLAHVQV